MPKAIIDPLEDCRSTVLFAFGTLESIACLETLRGEIPLSEASKILLFSASETYGQGSQRAPRYSSSSWIHHNRVDVADHLLTAKGSHDNQTQPLIATLKLIGMAVRGSTVGLPRIMMASQGFSLHF